MADTPQDLEPRLRAHLERVAQMPPPAGFEQRMIDVSTPPRRRSWSSTLVLVLVIAAITALFVLTTGTQVNNVFSNISSGLNQ